MIRWLWSLCIAAVCAGPVFAQEYIVTVNFAPIPVAYPQPLAREMDGIPIGAAQVQIFWDGNRNPTEAAIVFARDIPLDQADRS